MKAIKQTVMFALVLGLIVACGSKDNNGRMATGIQAKDVKDVYTAAQFYSQMKFVRAGHTGEPNSYLETDPIGGPRVGANYTWSIATLFMQDDNAAFVEVYTVQTPEGDPTKKLEGPAAGAEFLGKWSQVNMNLELDNTTGTRVALGEAYQHPRGSTINIAFDRTFPHAELAGKRLPFFRVTKNRNLPADLRDLVNPAFGFAAGNRIALGDK